MANNCSNSNTNSCSPCTGCEEVISSDCVSVLSNISCINMSSGDNLTDVLNALGSAVCNFYSLIDAGSGLTVEESDGSPSYGAINTLMFNQDSGFIVTQPGANQAEVRLIPTFLFPDSNLVIVDAVTTANITLSGAQTIDTIVGVAGTTKVLVWKQTLKTENGIYIMQAGAWTRSTDSDTSAELNDQVAFANYTKSGTTYGGNYFNQIITSPTIGADNIIYQKGILGGNKLSWLVDGNETGAVKVVGSIDNFDVKFQTFSNEIFRMFTTRQVGIGISASPLGKLHVTGTDTAILDQSTFYAEDYAQTNSFEIRRNGDIYRDHNIYSLARNVDGNTSWGEDALEQIDLTLARRNTAVGKYALEDLIDGWDNTAIGWWAGGEAIGDDCVYVGSRAGLNSIGDQNVFIGARADSSGIWSNSIALGYEAEIYGNNQFVIGSADAPIVNVYIGEGYRSSTPGSIILRGTQGNGSNISAGDFIIVPGAGTGTGTPGDFIVHKAPAAGVSGSGINASSETFKIKGTNGALYRNGVLYSINPASGSNTNLSWGYNTGTALEAGGVGTNNILIGSTVGNLVSSAVSNILIGGNGGGANTGGSLVSGIENTVIGVGAFSAGTAGRNTIIGYTVGKGITTGEHNIIVGHRTGRGAAGATVGVTTGIYNVIIGTEETTKVLGEGSNNTIVGNSAAQFLLDSNYVDSFGMFSALRTASSTSGEISNSSYYGVATIAQQSFECVLGGQYRTYFYLGMGKFTGQNDYFVDIHLQPHSPATGSAFSTGVDFANVTNGNGVDWYNAVSQPTGTGTAGDIFWQYAPTVQSSGVTQNALATGLQFNGADGSLRSYRRIETNKGVNVVAANDLTLGEDGNCFTITGNTTINAISNTNWQAGSVIYLIFTGTPTVKHNTAGSAGTLPMKLLNGVDFTISKNPTVISFVNDGNYWLEVSRSANAV